MKAKVIEKFYDLKEETLRHVGDEFELTEKRFDEINATAKKVYGAKFIESVEETKPSKKRSKKAVEDND